MLRPNGLHPATELVLLLCGLLVVFGIPSPLVPAAVLLCAAACAVLSSAVSLRRWLLTVAVLAGPMLIMVGLIQGLFYPGQEVTVLWSAGPAAVTAEGLAVALQLWLRVAAVIAVCALFGFSSDSARVFDAMTRLRLPLSIAYVCSAAMSLIPLLRHRTADALASRSARGWDVTRLCVRLRLLPGILGGLFTSVLVQLDQRHDTLTQRGFGRCPRPAPLQDHHDAGAQRLLRWAAAVLSTGLVAASVAGVLVLPTAGDLLGLMGIELVEGGGSDG